MLDPDKIKTIATVITIVGTLSAYGYNNAKNNQLLAQTQKDYDRLDARLRDIRLELRQDIKENREQINYLSSQSQAKGQMDKYQNQHIDELKRRIFGAEQTRMTF